MKSIVRHILIFALSLGICLQSLAGPRLCSSVFTLESSEAKPSFFRELFLPRAIKNFDTELYWRVRTSDFSKLQLSAKEMKKIEVKLALIDQVLPAGQLKWSERIFSLGLLRVRDLNALFSKYQIQDFQDPYLRKQFITQLYILHETPWMGLKKSVELSRNEGMQEWAVRTSEQRMLNAGLRGLVDEMSLGNASILKLAQLNLKKVLSSGWLGLPTRLPIMNKPLEPIFVEKMLWEGVAPHEQALRSLMRKDHATDAYNNFTRAYNKAAMVALIAVLYYTLPQMQDEFEEQVLKAQESHAQDPENVKKRDEAFQKAMENLDKMAEQIGELNKQDPKEQMFQETLAMFESANNRKATATEIQTLREKLGLPH